VTAVKRLTSLDALRGVAALCVVLWHWQHFFLITGDSDLAALRKTQPLYWLLKPLYEQGWIAVDLFFALSGFVLFWLYCEGIRERRMSAWHFATWRFSRLYPLHFLMLMTVAIMQIAFVSRNGSFFVYKSNDIVAYIQHLLMVQTWLPDAQLSFNGPTWSVSVEFLLYLIFFVACLVGLKRSWHCLLLALAGGVLLSFVEHIGRGLICFFMGGFAFMVWMQLREHVHVMWIARVAKSLALAAWLLALSMLYLDNIWISHGEGNVELLLVYDFLLCPLTVLALALHESSGGKTPRWLAFLGYITYSTYLLQFPMQLALALLATHFHWEPAVFMQVWVMVAFGAALIGMSTLSYHFFERPMQKWLRVKLTSLPSMKLSEPSS
jgi:peptidoglycan/LPS O-acetylase OafA/YrhL